MGVLHLSFCLLERWCKRHYFLTQVPGDNVGKKLNWQDQVQGIVYKSIRTARKMIAHMRNGNEKEAPSLHNHATLSSLAYGAEMWDGVLKRKQTARL